MRKFYFLLFSLLVLAAQFTHAQAQTKELWGLTKTDGPSGGGLIFKTDGSGNNQTVQQSFYGYNGSSPSGSLLQASDGRLYGMTPAGGANDTGIIFQFDPANNTYTKKVDFGDGLAGFRPHGSLMQASDGKLYGMTLAGGANNLGVIFQFDPATNTYTKKFDFTNAGGNTPHGILLQASDGMLYGMTSIGGGNNLGVIFQYDPATNIYTKEFDFAGATNGSHPKGSLIQASDGKLYGMTSDGGANNLGVMFQFDPATTTYVKKLDFAGC